MLQQIRQYKLSYMLYNLFKKNKLKHNIPLYKKYGINKSYFSSISSKDFVNLPASDRKVDYVKLAETPFFKKLTGENRESALQYDDNGYMILRNFLTPETADQINTEIDKLMEDGTLKFIYGGKLMFAIHHSEIIKNIGSDKELL